MPTFDIRFNNGSKFFVFGPTNCGKTWWWADFILNVEKVVDVVDVVDVEDVVDVVVDETVE